MGTPTLTATSTGYSTATTTFTITGVASQVVFTAGASQSLYTNQVSSVITVTREDAAGNAVTSGGSITVNLAKTSTTGSFYSNPGGTSAITTITIASGSSSASFYYKDTGTGSSTITASYTGLTPATTTFTITQNLLINAGFESATGGWTMATQNSGVESHIQSKDDITAHSGSNFAEIDTTGLASSPTSAYSALKQTFSSAIQVSSIPNTAGTLSIWVYNNGYNTQDHTSTGYYSFEINVTASDGSQLIYYWGNSPATSPANSTTVKVIDMGSLPGMFTVGQWVQFSTNLYQDWINSGLSLSASIASLTIQSNGYYQSGSVQYGQELFLDDVQIQ
jgi:hypothetical protein